jgi:trans-2,3-dihydro-3-hydroxyanthranilate isomerase
MSRPYAILDVFTDTPLSGNPLAVVLDAEGLDGDRMQAIAREFNLSETVFVLPPESPRHRARLRIFTPGRELPFAGHPTVGTAVLLALDGNGPAPAADVPAHAFGLEERIGIVPCVAEKRGPDLGFARFKLPRLPEYLGEGPSAELIADALGLEPSDIGFDRHAPSRHSAGVPFDLIPLASREAVEKAWPTSRFAEVFSGAGRGDVYVYSCRTVHPDHSFHTRMFAPTMGIPEDPATGAAAAAFAGALMEYEPLGEGTHDVFIEQGFAMGRPSLIGLQLQIESGALVSAEIGGAAVVVARGELKL